jgi:hypothetical protein
MVQCSRHVIPPAVAVVLTDRQAHDLELELEARAAGVLICRWLGTSLPHPDRRLVDPIR